jgi:integrase
MPPYRQKDSAYWWISYTDSTGQRIRRSAGTTHHADAKAEEQSLRAKAHTARKQTPAGLLLGTVLAEYLKRDNRLSPRNTSIARALAGHFAALDAHQLDLRAVWGYIDHRRAHGIADATIKRDLTLLGAAITEYTKRFGVTLPNPARAANLREPEGRTRWITPDEAARLIACATPAVADFIKLGLYTGMRSGEIHGLTWDRVDLQRGTIRLEAQHTKTKRSRSIPIHPIARQALASCRARWPDSDRVFVIGSIKKGFAGACHRAGITDFTPHDLRHTCASWLVQKGVSLYEVRDILGHSSIKLTERYSHLAPENLASAIAKLGAL